MGLRKWEIDKKMDEIIDFAGVEKYLDTPVKRYSSGMYVRLAFAVAAHLEPDILIVDEVLAVGDLEFQKKCLGKMKDVSDKQGRTILFVSHDLNAVKSFCKTSSLLHNGEIVTSGPTSFVIEKYLSDDKSHFYQSSKCKANELFVESVLVLDSSQESKYLFDISEEIYVSFKLKNVSHSSNANGKYDLFVTVSDAHRKKIFSAEIKITEDLYTLNINKNQLTKGVYYIEVMINIPKYGPTEHLRDVVKFQILDDSSWMFKHGDYDCGAVFGNYSWIIN
jgi:lipopolysaccharide transport system ATP-binding protein